MELGSGSLTGGVWGSFPTTSSGGGNELDLWVSYDFGPLALTVTNYSFPTNDGTYGDGNPGLFDSDWMEISGSRDRDKTFLNVKNAILNSYDLLKTKDLDILVEDSAISKVFSDS